jgi:glucose/arabinose dehydrogenase
MMRLRVTLVLAACCALVAAVTVPLESSTAQSIGLEVVVSGIDRPSHVTQAPGDPTSLYYIEQRLGRIRKLDLNSGTSSTVHTFTGFDTTIEGGVHTLAFHPQFEQNGLFYVSWLEDGGPGIGDYGNVDEFQMVNSQAQFSKRVLRHQIRDSASTHGLDHVGFDPTATGDAQNYLYITTGDGGFDGATLSNNFSQSLNTRFGKVMRVDVSGDDYPAEPQRNYSIPDDNPYANDGDPNTLGEVWLSGLRNPWRISWDRENGDMYIGDVGLNAREEINFVKAGASGLDYGWNAFEGTVGRGKASLHPNPLFPIHEYTHAGGNVSITGGFVYRGPIESLQGEYFFADFNTANVWSGVFDRDTPTGMYNGANMEITTWTSALNGSLPGSPMGHIVSFGEDLAGNLYLVDYGQGNLFEPTPGTGAIYRLALVPELGDLNVDTQIDLADWLLLKAGFVADLTGLSPSQKYLKGDLDRNGVIDLRDVNLFEGAYEEFNGAGSFESLAQQLAVPEPQAIALLGVAAVFVGLCRRRARYRRV